MRAVRGAAFRLFHALRGKGVLPRTRALYDRLQWNEGDRLEAYARSRRLGLLRHAAASVPYYRTLLAGVDPERWVDDEARWCSIPLLDKRRIRAEGERLLAEDVEPARRVPNATSGSTGESLRFFLDAASKPHRAAATHRFLAWTGLKPWDRQAKLWGARFDAPGQSLRDRLRGWMEPGLFLSSYRLSEDDMRAYARALVDFAPRGLTSYPTPLARFAEFCRAEGVRLPGLRAIQCSAEQLHAEQRSRIEEVFGVPVFDRYGSREFANVAMECEHHRGLHVASDRVYLEILDGEGRPCPPGRRGEIVITDLDNHAMPFVRYRTGDVGVWAEGPCACGRGLPRLARLEGRVLELVRTPDGHVISGTFWPQIVKQSSPDVELYQVEQSRLESIVLRLKMSSGRPLGPQEEERLRARLGEHAPDLGLEIVYVDDIPCTRSGKRRTVISHLA